MSIANSLYPDEKVLTGRASYFDIFERTITVFAIVGFTNFIAFALLGGADADPTAIFPDVSGPARASWYPIYLAVLIISIVRWRTMLATLPKAWPIILLFTLAFLSIQWSIAPSITVRRCIALFFTLHFGFYLAARAPLLDTLRLLGWTWLAITIISLGFIFLLPSKGIDHDAHVGAWTGFLGTKNLMGGEMARAHLIFVGLLFYDAKHRAAWISGLALTALCVLGSTSKTALLAMIAPYGLFAVYMIAHGSVIISLLSIWGAVSFAGIGYFILANFSDELVKLIGKDLTFSGRTDIWELCFFLVSKEKWTGYGYGAFWKVADGPALFLEKTLEWDVPNAHNSWVEVSLSLGYPGLAVLIIMTIMALTKSMHLMTGRHGPIPLMMLLQLIMFSLSESLLLQQNFHSSMLFAFVVSFCLLGKKVPNPVKAARSSRFDVHRPERLA
ncbi:MAG: O-antigen polymerase [Hirschia sp.]|nr:O-antigen polymerase [Hirschia sp.]MBF18367.1 O-antigen polymerase [Hirschia sp.]